MNTPLWMSISTFNLDEPISEYRFSTRLAKENHWTAGFTQKAITEYKKFMYLAATAGDMVSPSPIVDIVWHQHLIFTESYTSLCGLIGKNIQHIPSTHNREQADRFRQAAERTKELYNSTFGEQPKDIWEAEDIFDWLRLPRARWKVNQFTGRSALLFIVLVIPCYILLKPLYVHIDNPYFLIGYMLLCVMALTVLNIYNKAALTKIVAGFDEAAYIRHLQPAELIYLKEQNLAAVVHGSVDQLLKEKKIVINNDQTIQLLGQNEAQTAEEFTVRQVILTGAISYPVLLRQLILKPVWANIKGSMDAFRQHFIQSRAFGNLFYLNVCVLLFILMLGLVRILTGLARHKPVALIIFFTVVMLFALLIFLAFLSYAVCNSIIPALYKNQILPEKRHQAGLDWQYFLIGAAVLSPEFVPMVKHYDSHSGSSGGDSSGGSDGSCGSSCGGGCGGCGGGGD